MVSVSQQQVAQLAQIISSSRYPAVPSSCPAVEAGDCNPGGCDPSGCEAGDCNPYGCDSKGSDPVGSEPIQCNLVVAIPAVAIPLVATPLFAIPSVAIPSVAILSVAIPSVAILAVAILAVAIPVVLSFLKTCSTNSFFCIFFYILSLKKESTSDRCLEAPKRPLGPNIDHAIRKCFFSKSVIGARARV